MSYLFVFGVGVYLGATFALVGVIAVHGIRERRELAEHDVYPRFVPHADHVTFDDLARHMTGCEISPGHGYAIVETLMQIAKLPVSGPANEPRRLP